MPLKFDYKHYVPILKTKAGERWAVDHLSSKVAKGITPLFEIHRHKTKDDSSHIGDMCENISSIWSRSCFLDTKWLETPSGDATNIASAFNCAREQGIRAIPVVRVTYDSDALDVIAEIMGEDKRGCLIRVTPDEAESDRTINAILKSLGIAKRRRICSSITASTQWNSIPFCQVFRVWTNG